MTAGSANKLELCAELGAEITIDYHNEDFVEVIREAGGADVILDIMGRPTWTATSTPWPRTAAW